MNLQEQISRIQSMMGLNEVSNPYSITWIEPTREYFIQELNELLGNSMRFGKEEFFNPINYDVVYSILPHTFKMIAEYSKGSDIENEQEIKDILLNKETDELVDDWGEFQDVIMNDPKSKREALNLYNMGRMEEWDDDKISQTRGMGKLTNQQPHIKDTTSSGLIKQMGDNINLQGYKKNVEDFRHERHRELPPPFVMRLPSGGRDGKEYTLIGGHKRSTVASQLNLPITAWFIDLT
jgi:hypothetical protein